MADIVDRTGGLSRNEYRHSSIVYDLCPKWEIDGAQLMVWRTQLNCLVSRSRRSRRSRPEPKMDDPDRATGSASPNTCHPASGLHCSSTDQEQSLSASILTPASARATSNQKAQAPGQAPNDLAKAPDLDRLVFVSPIPDPFPTPRLVSPRLKLAAHPSPAAQQTRDRVRRERAASQITVRRQARDIDSAPAQHGGYENWLFFHRLHQLHFACRRQRIDQAVCLCASK